MKTKLEFPVWKINTAAEEIVQRALQQALRECPEAKDFSTRLLEQCGVRLRDLLDHLVLPAGFVEPARLAAAGWTADAAEPGVLRNKGGFFPAILRGEKLAIAFKVEHVSDFESVVIRKALCVIRGFDTSDGLPHQGRRITAWLERIARHRRESALVEPQLQVVEDQRNASASKRWK